MSPAGRASTRKVPIWRQYLLPQRTHAHVLSVRRSALTNLAVAPLRRERFMHAALSGCYLLVYAVERAHNF